MADTKITALAAIGANPINVATFPIPMVDLLDTSMAASGTTKKVTVNQILGAGGTATLASATITGDLTVDTSTLKVDSTNNRVGVNTTTPDAPLDVTSAGTASTYTVSAVIQDGTYPASGNPTLEFNGFIGGNGYRSGIGSIGGQQLAFYTPSTFGVAPTERYRIASDGVATWSNVGGVAGTAMTLNSTGLGVGATPVVPLHIYTGGTGTTAFSNTIGTFRSGAVGRNVSLQFSDTSNQAYIGMLSGALQFAAGGSSTQLTLDTSGNVGVGITPSYRLQSAVASGADGNIFAAQVIGASNGFQVLWNHATTTTRVIIANIPTSSAGLAAGTLWNDAGTIKIA